MTSHLTGNFGRMEIMRMCFYNGAVAECLLAGVSKALSTSVRFRPALPCRGISSEV